MKFRYLNLGGECKYECDLCPLAFGDNKTYHYCLIVHRDSPFFHEEDEYEFWPNKHKMKLEELKDVKKDLEDSRFEQIISYKLDTGRELKIEKAKWFLDSVIKHWPNISVSSFILEKDIRKLRNSEGRRKGYILIWRLI